MLSAEFNNIECPLAIVFPHEGRILETRSGPGVLSKVIYDVRNPINERSDVLRMADYVCAAFNVVFL